MQVITHPHVVRGCKRKLFVMASIGKSKRGSLLLMAPYQLLSLQSLFFYTCTKRRVICSLVFCCLFTYKSLKRQVIIRNIHYAISGEMDPEDQVYPLTVYQT